MPRKTATQWMGETTNSMSVDDDGVLLADVDTEVATDLEAALHGMPGRA